MCDIRFNVVLSTVLHTKDSIVMSPSCFPDQSTPSLEKERREGKEANSNTTKRTNNKRNNKRKKSRLSKCVNMLNICNIFNIVPIIIRWVGEWGCKCASGCATLHLCNSKSKKFSFWVAWSHTHKVVASQDRSSTWTWVMRRNDNYINKQCQGIYQPML